MAFQLTKIVSELHSLGFAEREIALYLVLKRMGPSSLSDISENMRFSPRATSDVLRSLSKKGLVSQMTTGKRKRYSSEEPKKLNSIADEKQWEIEDLKRQVGPLVSSLDRVFPDEPQQSETEVELIEGIGNVKKALAILSGDAHHLCLPKSMKTNTDLCVSEDRVLFISEKDTPSVIMIRNKRIARSTETLLQLAQKSLKKRA